MKRLKPCPFCGLKPTIQRIEEVRGWAFYRITCKDLECPATAVHASNAEKSETIRRWNTRVNATDTKPKAIKGKGRKG